MREDDQCITVIRGRALYLLVLHAASSAGFSLSYFSCVSLYSIHYAWISVLQANMHVRLHVVRTSRQKYKVGIATRYINAGKYIALFTMMAGPGTKLTVVASYHKKYRVLPCWLGTVVNGTTLK